MWAVDFAVRLQQTWGPVMAKGIEDTTFYRWHRLVALNEVGGDPAVVEHADPAVLHDWAARQQRDWPRGMTTLSTHDTKRSEDVRARLLAVAEDTASWRACSRAFATAADAAGVDRPTAHLLWQTLVGVGPISRERLHGYLTKAMREAKRHTGWLAVNEEYEARVQAFADSAVADGDLHEAVASAVRENLPIRAAVLGQKLLQLLLPGTPDTYQGTEVVDLSLVDPDNRRPVDYEDREARLARLAQEATASLDDEKLLVTSRALRVRRELSDAFGEKGTYAPLAASTEHALGVVRGDRVVGVVTRLPRRLADAGGWADHRDAARRHLAGRAHRPVLLGGEIARAEVLERFPVALLVARCQARRRHRPGEDECMTSWWAPPTRWTCCCRATEGHDARRGRHRASRSTCPPGRRPTRLPRRRRPAPRPARRGSRRAARLVAAVRPGRVPAGPTTAGPGPRSRARSSTSCTSARSPPRAPSTPRSPGSATWPTSASRWSSCSRSRRSPARTAGGTTGSRPTPCTRSTAARRRCSGSSTRRTPRPRGLPRRGLQPPRPRRELPGGVRALPDRQAQHPVGPGAQPRRPQSDPVRRWVLDNVAQWLDAFHVDALRLDAVHELHDDRATHLLEEMAREVDALAERLGRPLTLIAESDRNDPRTVTPRGRGHAVGGLGLHGQWADDVHHALHVALTGETQGYYGDFTAPEALGKAMRSPFFHDGTWSSFRGRVHGRPVDPGTVPGWRFVASLQTHDQVGNRAVGDRLSATLPAGLLACGAALLLTAPWTPMLFMGEEWGARTPWQYFTDHTDPALGEAVRQGRRAEFASHGWEREEVPDPQSAQTFEDSKLDWAEPGQEPHARLLRWYRDLIRLRRDLPDLHDGRLDLVQPHHDHERGLLLVVRGSTGSW